MTRVTLGKLLLQAARGEQEQQTITTEQMRSLGQGIMHRAQRELENLRKEQQKALEQGRAGALRKRRGG